MVKNLILETFKDTIKLIKKHNHIVILMFFLQLIFFSLLAVNITTTMTPAVQATTDVLSYVNSLKMDELAFTEDILTNKSMFGKDPMIVYRNYKAVTQFLRLFIAISILIFVIFEGLNWAFTVYLPKKKQFKLFVRFMLNFLVLTIMYFTVIGIIISGQLKSIVRTPTIPTYQIIITSILVILLIYFMVISYSLLNNKNLFTIIKKAFLIGTFKAYLILPIILFNILLMLLVSFLLLKTAEANLFLVILALILFTFSYIFTRILFVKLIHGVDS